MTGLTDTRWSGMTDLPFGHWILLAGSRPRLALLLTAAVTAVAAGLTAVGVVYVGPGSALSTVLASGMLGGLATIVTVTLSINQLILSRVFGTPADLTDRLEGNLEFRATVERIADEPGSPNDPGSFLSLVAGTLETRAAALERMLSGADVDDEVREEFESFTSGVVDYADHLQAGEDSESTIEVLLLTFGTEYADHIDDARRLRSLAVEDRPGDHVEGLPEDTGETLEDILELLKGVAIVRQFFKTLSVQQDLASLSRQLIYTGVPGIATAYLFAQVYGTAPATPTLPAPWLGVLGVAVVAVLFAPLAVLVSYILRVATVTLYTVSVGSFIPPEERVGREES